MIFESVDDYAKDKETSETPTEYPNRKEKRRGSSHRWTGPKGNCEQR